MTEMIRTRVQLRHAHPLLAAGIGAILARAVEFIDPAEDAAAQEAIVIADLAAALALRSPHRLLVVEPALTPPKLKALLRAGLPACVSADGSPEQLMIALQALQQDGRYFCPLAVTLLPEALSEPSLTQRERDVLALLCEGLDNKSIALRMAVAPGTVKTHVKALLTKTGTRNRTALVAGTLRA